MGFHKPLVTLDEVCEISGEMWSDSNMSLTLQQHHQALERKEKMALKCCCVQGWMCTGCSVVMRKLLLLFSNYMHSYPAGQIENNEKITGNCACITGSLLSPFDLIFSLCLPVSLFLFSFDLSVTHICHRPSCFRCICSALYLNLLQLSEAFHLGKKLLADDLSLQRFHYNDFGLVCVRSCSV